jgi:signal transduction histidine kinase
VDDNPTNLEVISEALSDAGLEVAIATSGERALQQIEHCRPDLILLDVMMPGIDGFETCRRIKALEYSRSVPIIFMTALDDTTSKVKALEMGAVDYIAKPFHEQEVIARVRTHLQLHQLTKSLATQVAQKTAELQASQLQLIQQEKMSALGGLIAGVAHEINNPISCIVGNIEITQEYFQDLIGVLELYRQQFPQPGAALESCLETIDVDYLRQDLPKLIHAMQDSSERIKAISRSLRTFSRTDTDQPQLFDLHEGLDSTLMILRHRLNLASPHPAIAVVKQYGDLPLISCFPGPLNQVFMNLLANAIEAIEDGLTGLEPNPTPQKQTIQPMITLTTGVKTMGATRWATVAIADQGPGIPESVRQHIFEHLFTTKPAGKGTGLGLAIAQQIIVQQHRGTLQVDSEPGQGTVFTLCLPMEP